MFACTNFRSYIIRYASVFLCVIDHNTVQGLYTVKKTVLIRQIGRQMTNDK